MARQRRLAELEAFTNFTGRELARAEVRQDLAALGVFMGCFSNGV